MVPTGWTACLSDDAYITALCTVSEFNENHSSAFDAAKVMLLLQALETH